MATEYKLSYTAADIDDRLRKANEAVLFSEAQELTDEQKKQVQDNLGIVQSIYPFPTETGTLRPTWQFVDIDKLEVGKLYSRAVNEDKTSLFYIGIKADDGSEKSISLISTTSMNMTQMYYITNSNNISYTVNLVGSSTYYTISAKNRSTADDIIVNTLQAYQAFYDSDLTTTDKTTCGAINELNAGKADKSELVQSDWNQNDETTPDYIKNRTHYEEEIVITWDGTSDIHDEYAALYLVETDEKVLSDIANSSLHKIGWNGSEASIELNKYVFNNYIILGASKLANIYSPWHIQALLILENNTSVIVGSHIINFASKGLYLQKDIGEYVSPLVYTVVKKIDEKYLEIATDDEIIEMLIDTDMFPVVTDSDGSMLADENGDILLW